MPRPRPSPFLADLDTILEATLAEQLKPLGLVGVRRQPPRAFVIRLAPELLLHAICTGACSKRAAVDALYEQLARVAASLLILDEHPVALICQDEDNEIRFRNTPEHLEACGVTPAVFARMQDQLCASVTAALFGRLESADRPQ